MADCDRVKSAWLNYNCAQSNNWITLYKFNEIANHPERRVYETTKDELGIKRVACATLGVPELTIDNLSHIYFTYMTESKLITLVKMCNGEIYLINNSVELIENSNENGVVDGVGNGSESENQPEKPKTLEFKDEMIEKGIPGTATPLTCVGLNDGTSGGMSESLPQMASVASEVTRLCNLGEICQILSAKELKLIGLRRKDFLKSDLKKVQRDELSRTCFLDFVGLQDDGDVKYLTILKRFVASASQTNGQLNFTHNYTLRAKYLSMLNMAETKNVTSLSINQNFLIDDYAWLAKFPTVRALSFWYNHRLDLPLVQQICQMMPQLEVINFHGCCCINLRILLPLLKLRNLVKIAVDDPMFWCQKGIHELFILPEEWKTLHSDSLEKIAINSDNLTLDVIDYIIGVCPKLQQFIISDKLLPMISRNATSGYQPNIVSFHSWDSPNKGLQFHRNIRFKGMFKDTYNAQMFSESMLRQIQANRDKDLIEA
jgi:hypothetical protein